MVVQEIDNFVMSSVVFGGLVVVVFKTTKTLPNMLKMLME